MPSRAEYISYIDTGVPAGGVDVDNRGIKNKNTHYAAWVRRVGFAHGVEALAETLGYGPIVNTRILNGHNIMQWEFDLPQTTDGKLVLGYNRGVHIDKPEDAKGEKKYIKKLFGESNYKQIPVIGVTNLLQHAFTLQLGTSPVGQFGSIGQLEMRAHLARYKRIVTNRYFEAVMPFFAENPLRISREDDLSVTIERLAIFLRHCRDYIRQNTA